MTTRRGFLAGVVAAMSSPSITSATKQAPDGKRAFRHSYPLPSKVLAPREGWDFGVTIPLAEGEVLGEEVDYEFDEPTALAVSLTEYEDGAIEIYFHNDVTKTPVALPKSIVLTGWRETA